MLEESLFTEGIFVSDEDDLDEVVPPGTEDAFGEEGDTEKKKVPDDSEEEEEWEFGDSDWSEAA